VDNELAWGLVFSDLPNGIHGLVLIAKGLCWSLGAFLLDLPGVFFMDHMMRFLFLAYLPPIETIWKK
jgi:hypothetical protein